MLNIMTHRYLRVATFFSLLFLLVGCQTTRKPDVPDVGNKDNVQKEVTEQLRRELHTQKQRTDELEEQLKMQNS